MLSLTSSFSLLFFALSAPIASGSVDLGFYDLLGVSSDADLRTIRRAFKKLALEKHPDKNPNNPDAHSVFVRINRAYEVLKDDELRKRYDQFGEKGMEEDGAGQRAQQQNYQSWEFYNDKFGIYDDDPEIITLSRSDFHEEVFGSGEVWFINFYSTYCSHCHHLAPTWREFARSMEGIVRVGAVNCAEDLELCQSQQVIGYPSLVLFPQRIWFQSQRELGHLRQFLLSNLPSQPLRSPSEIPPARQPFLIEFCDGEECWEESERVKCAAMLSRIGGTFAVLNCDETKLCAELGKSDGFHFYPEGIEKEGTEVFFADLSDLRSQLHQLLPELPNLGADELRWLIQREGDPDSEPTVAIFVENAEKVTAEWKTTAQRFPEMNIRTVFCSDSVELTSLCDELHLEQMPRPVLFRPSGGYDIHYGNLQFDARQLSKFISQSRNAGLVMLSPQKYSEIPDEVSTVQDDQEQILWLVDHFAPWCSPCLRLLSELRKLPMTVQKRTLRVGTVNCNAHLEICREAGANSYPHSVLFTPDGVRHPLVGFHSSDQLIEFIAEALNPSVEILNATSFSERVIHRPNGVLFFVDFFAPWCSPCQQLAPEFRRMARQFPLVSPLADKIRFGAVDCDAFPDICDAEYVHSFPTIRLYRHRPEMQPYDYPPNWWRNAQSMSQWLSEMMPSLVHRLAGDFHSVVLGSVEPFLVDFYAPWCGHCVQFAPTFEKLAKLLEGDVRLGKVDCERFGHLCKMAGIQAFPSILLYPGVDRVGARQPPQGVFVQHEHNAERMAEEVRRKLGIGKGVRREERDEL